MRINSKYIFRKYLDEVYLIPEEWDKANQDDVFHFEGSGGEIVNIIYENPNIELNLLQLLVCKEYTSSNVIDETIANEVSLFVNKLRRSEIIE